MVTGWPFGTLRSVHRKVNAYLPNITYILFKKLFFFIYIINTLSSAYFTGPVFGNMDNFTGLGVFVDTYPNEEKQLEVCCLDLKRCGESTAGLRVKPWTSALANFV